MGTVFTGHTIKFGAASLWQDDCLCLGNGGKVCDRVERTFHDTESDIGNGAEGGPHRCSAVAQSIDDGVDGIGGRLRYIVRNFGRSIDDGLCRIA